MYMYKASIPYFVETLYVVNLEYVCWLQNRPIFYEYGLFFTQGHNKV